MPDAPCQWFESGRVFGPRLAHLRSGGGLMTAFQTRVRLAIQNSGLQKALAFATKQARSNRAGAFAWLESQGLEPETMRDRGHAIKEDILADLDAWIDRLEKSVRINGG